ncbi:hypothetical protein L6452_28383 [Arctium lappa]|uniref:Uncharacterized protein n=1 Tax=Arctium lappa TaxID=4217 RepID=A0ACB8ZYA6_ARCLA|nr:hypothetical protein L6452_28383 [Arctium lappa]
MQPAMWTIRIVLEDFDLQYVYVLEGGLGQDLNQQSFEFDPFGEEHGDDSEYSYYMEEEMAEVGVDMKNFSSIIDWDLEWLGNKEQLV